MICTQSSSIKINTPKAVSPWEYFYSFRLFFTEGFPVIFFQKPLCLPFAKTDCVCKLLQSNRRVIYKGILNHKKASVIKRSRSLCNLTHMRYIGSCYFSKEKLKQRTGGTYIAKFSLVTFTENFVKKVSEIRFLKNIEMSIKKGGNKCICRFLF